jgi:hypothetical protein
MWPFEISSLEAAEHAHIDSPRVKTNAQAAEEHESKDKGSRAKASMLRGIAPVATSKEECVIDVAHSSHFECLFYAFDL